MKSKHFSFIFVTTIMLSTFSSKAAVWSVKYARPPNTLTKRIDYPVELLKLALDATGVRYELVTSERIMNRARAIRQIKRNREINVFWSMTDKQIERDLLPIRIPITKGLIGWRIAFIRKDDRAKFNQIASLKDILSFVPVQGANWSDTHILRANGFSVNTADLYSGLLEDLVTGKSDFFPRAVIEIRNEWEQLQNKEQIFIEGKFVLQYPAAIYFFVNKSNRILANLIETGLMKSIESGDFDRLFNATFQKPLAELELDNRQVFRLSNPLMPSDAPINNSELWFEL
jgi:hypothetical protein